MCTSSYCFVRDWYTGSSVSDNILSYVDAGDHTCTVTDWEGNTGQVLLLSILKVGE